MSSSQAYAPIPASVASPASQSSRFPSRRNLLLLALAFSAASIFAFVTFKKTPLLYHTPAPINHQTTTTAQWPVCPCPRIFAPVCCVSPFGIKTTGNDCECKCAHGHVIHPGPCKKPDGVQCVCPAIYDPVCCWSNGKLETASNDCICKCSGGLVLRPGECPHHSARQSSHENLAQTPVRAGCICPKIYRPVCCKTKYGTGTAPNACVCECYGTVVHPGPCH